MSMHIVVVDIEGTGKTPAKANCIPVEVAWWDLTTDGRGSFIPVHDEQQVLDWAAVDPEVADALEINRYRERIVGRPQDVDGTELIRFASVIDGQIMAGANVGGYDRPMVAKLWPSHWTDGNGPGRFPEAHYRTLELASYAAGVLRLPIHQEGMPGLRNVAARLDLPTEMPHTATSDVTLLGVSFRRLFQLAEVPL